ncbi:hypothetical protein Taro_023888 [Colocasia esculenta]|uniref:Uncharacterized protein n=1 Tax=Colocasia esculenta TaxID=4460 RepID=A0A843VIP3_COLES|nr:hypothetical protein [Colocasia esculenta]
MPATGHYQCLLFFSLLLASLHLAAAMIPALAPAPAADANATAHRILARFGFPQGLLPGNVVSHTLSHDEQFEVELSEPCYTWFSDLAYFEKTIRGRIAFGRITSLSGIQVRKYFIWVDIKRVVASKDGGSLVFTAGFLTERHPASEFQDVHRCEKRAEISSSGPGGGRAGVAVA